MVAENTDGSTTADGTEQTLATISSAGIYFLRLDLTNLAEGDRVVLRAKTESRASESALLLAYEVVFSGPVVEVIVDSPPLAIPVSGQVRFTLEQTDGTNRVYEWSILDLAS